MRGFLGFVVALTSLVLFFASFLALGAGTIGIQEFPLAADHRLLVALLGAAGLLATIMVLVVRSNNENAGSIASRDAQWGWAFTLILAVGAYLCRTWAPRLAWTSGASAGLIVFFMARAKGTRLVKAQSRRLPDEKVRHSQRWMEFIDWAAGWIIIGPALVQFAVACLVLLVWGAISGGVFYLATGMLLEAGALTVVVALATALWVVMISKRQLYDDRVVYSRWRVATQDKGAMADSSLPHIAPLEFDDGLVEPDTTPRSVGSGRR